MGVDCLLQNKVMVGNKEEKKSSMYESRRKKKKGAEVAGRPAPNLVT